jgi:hypothetical protein
MNNGWGDMVATLDFPWLSFLKRKNFFLKKLFDRFFFSIQIFKNSTIGATIPIKT